MMRAAWTLLAACAVAPLALAQGGPGLLPTRPEVSVNDRGSERLLSVRAADCRALDVVAALTAEGGVAIVVDGLAETQLRQTIVTVELHDRPAEEIVTLLAVAAGVDVTPEVHVFRLEGPPRPGAAAARTTLWHAAERFYELSLARLQDEASAARAQRGLAELNRVVGDWTTAYAHYEALIARFPRAPEAAGAELALADCYVKAGEDAQARKMLKRFLDRCSDPKVLEQALRRLLTLLLEAGRLRDVEDLRTAFLRIGALAPESVAALSAAGSVLVEKGYHGSAVLLLQELWSRDPQAHASLGPVLALALVAQDDLDAAAQVLKSTCERLDGAAISAPARLAFAELATRAGKTSEAIVFGHGVLASDDASPGVQLRAHLLLFHLYRDLGLVPRARTHLYAAEELSGGKDAAELSLESARMALAAGQPVEARLLFQESLRHPDAVHAAELGIVKALLESDDLERARTMLRAIFARSDLDASAYALAQDLAVDVLEAAGDLDGARRALRGDLGALAQGGDAEAAPRVMDTIDAEEPR